MRRLHLDSTNRTTPRATARDALRWFVSVMAVHDMIVAAYFIVLGVALVWVGQAFAGAMRGVAIGLSTLALGCVVGRAAHGLPSWFRSAAYRIGVLAAVAQGYVVLRAVLPLISPGSVDAALIEMDRAVFRGEPAVWLDRFASPPVVEYFAFFYFSYFGICAIYAAAMLGVRPLDRATSEFAIGGVIVCCVGQLGYAIVPALGPVHMMTSAFDGPLSGGFWWACVNRTVDAASAQKDVFPSLHTALPTYFTLFAWRMARTSRPWRWVTIMTGVFAAHIIVSTMLLRWHYLVDVLAGLALAVAAAGLSPAIARWEARRRSDLEAPAVWGFGG